MNPKRVVICVVFICSAAMLPSFAQVPDIIPVADQPLAANARRVLDALNLLGAPLPAGLAQNLRVAIQKNEGAEIQRLIDREVVFHVQINPETRVKVSRGAARIRLQQAGFVPVIVKVINQSTATPVLRIYSPQAGQNFGGMSPLSAERMQRLERNETADPTGDPKRFLDLEIYDQAPLTAQLSGLEAEYKLAVIYSRDAGQRDAIIGFDVGQQTQDLGFRGEVTTLLEIAPAMPVTLRIADVDGQPTTARLVFRDSAGHIYPPQAKRLAPDFYFQEQIYRADGELVLLPPGKVKVEYSRGPEYRVLKKDVVIPDQSKIQNPKSEIALRLERWIDPAAFGFFSGDHHIHGAGCAHYTSPTQGVMPEHMFQQVKGEGLNVGCILTWGPCFDYQRRFFSPTVNQLSEPFTLVKYDLEISGFGSEALGHVCLINLKDQTYPGSDGTKIKGWPTWTTPVMRWAKEQGGIAGYAHSASGLQIAPASAAKRLMLQFDSNHDRVLSPSETRDALLPEPFGLIDADQDGALTETELIAALDKAADRLPNLAIPEMNSVGAMEVCVSTAAGVCDFMSAMDTARIPEWNMWCHILNCGFPLKISGETDFPCMSGDRVGQGRVYVFLGKTDRLDFTEWCRGLAAGKSYVSDGFGHALEFTVNGTAPGFGEVRLEQPGVVRIHAKVAFAPETPRTVAQGLREPAGGKRWLGDTVTLHGPRIREASQGGMRLVEIVVNGRSVAKREVAADSALHDLEFDVPVQQSSWIALRQFPELHTNPVNVLVAGRPIRASRSSALWCIETIEQLWRVRGKNISANERTEARRAFDAAIDRYRQIATEAPPGT